MSSPRDGKDKIFYEWCWKHLRSANNKQYSTGTLKTYLGVGFAANPEKYMTERRAQQSKRDDRVRVVGQSIVAAVKSGASPKVVPIAKLKERYSLPTNVAQEVNVLMRAWESASSPARSQFIHLVTGQRIKVA